MLVAPLSPDSVQRVADVVMEHPHRAALSALAYTVLSRQAEGGSLFAGKKYMRQQARDHGVNRPQADTSHGNLLQILERGPEADSDFGLVAAFALRGFDAAVAAADDDARTRLVERFVAQLDWLTLASRYRLQPLIVPLVSDATLALVRQAVLRAIQADQSASGEGDAAARARVAARLCLLERIDPEAEARAELATEASDPFTVSLLAPFRPPAEPAVENGSERHQPAQPEKPAEPEVQPEIERASEAQPEPAREDGSEVQPKREAEASDTDAGRVSGPVSSAPGAPVVSRFPAMPEARVQARLSRAPGGALFGLLRWLSGWALLSWLLQALGRLVGVRRLGAFSLEPAGIRVWAETRAAGRVWGQSDQVLRLTEVRFGRRHVRYPALRRLVGLLAFCLGCLVGAIVLYDGLAVMERNLVLIGAGLIGAGVLLDLLFDVVLAGARGRVALELSAGGRRFCLRDVPLEEADRFMDALARSAPQPR